MLALHDYTAVVHLHSTHSDGTGTVAEIAAAGRENALDVVLLTDHDTLAARETGEEGWYGGTLVVCGVEISPRHGDHYLAFGLQEPIDHRGLDARGIAEAVRDRGGFGFCAHPFSHEPHFRLARPMPWLDFEAPIDGVELWSFLADTGEQARGPRDIARFLRDPRSLLARPPERNLREWDRLCRDRRIVAIGGLDAHQIGVRIGERVPLRLMAYRRSFRHLRTHLLSERAMTGSLEPDRATALEALREGRCYIALDSFAPAQGFRFEAESDGDLAPMGAERALGDGWMLRAEAPRECELRLLRDGRQVAIGEGARTLTHRAREPGAYRVEAHLRSGGADRTWILSNPVYLRSSHPAGRHRAS